MTRQTKIENDAFSLVQTLMEETPYENLPREQQETIALQVSQMMIDFAKRLLPHDSIETY